VYICKNDTRIVTLQYKFRTNNSAYYLKKNVGRGFGIACRTGFGIACRTGFGIPCRTEESIDRLVYRSVYRFRPVYLPVY